MYVVTAAAGAAGDQPGRSIGSCSLKEEPSFRLGAAVGEEGEAVGNSSNMVPALLEE